MNKILVLLSIALVGCAHGVTDDFNVEVETNTVSIPPRPAPEPLDDASEPDLNGKECKVVQTVYADNCVLKVIKCTDGTMDIDSYCYGPPYVPKYENVPDPPYHNENHNE